MEYCPACNAEKGKALGPQVYECGACGALYGTCYLGQSYEYVLPYWDTYKGTALQEIKYFDFECIGSKGLTRRHGWFNPKTKKIVQIG